MPTLLARVRALAPVSSPPLPDGLSIRELDVLRLVARGLSNREIGATLFISEHTAANHVRSILRKTACANRTEATAYAYRRGLAPRAERCRSIQHMPMYVIERAFAEQLDLTSDDVKLIEEVNADEGVRWLFSFLSADRRRSYCLYEAPSPDMIVAAAKRVGIPADVVVEVDRISADMYA